MRLLELRISNKLSQKELGKALDLTQQRISLLDKAKVIQIPSRSQSTLRILMCLRITYWRSARERILLQRWRVWCVETERFCC